MSEITVQFKNAINGYKKSEVDRFLKEEIEVRLQQKSAEIANLQKQVSDLEAKLSKLTGGDGSVEEKVELYDKLMKKMDGDYENLLAPAIAKAKAIEEKANKEYEIRMDQAKYAAEGIYTEAADRIAGVVDANMDRLYGLLDEFIYSKTIPGRIQTFVNNCKLAASKIANAISGAVQGSKNAINKVSGKAKEKVAKAKEAINTYKGKNTDEEAVAEEN